VLYRYSGFEGECEVGDSMTYPLSNGNWRVICILPEIIARGWRCIVDKDYPSTWTNKEAFVVTWAVGLEDSPIALYLHDDTYYLIQPSRYHKVRK